MAYLADLGLDDHLQILFSYSITLPYISILEIPSSADHWAMRLVIKSTSFEQKCRISLRHMSSLTGCGVDFRCDSTKRVVHLASGIPDSKPISRMIPGPGCLDVTGGE